MKLEDKINKAIVNISNIIYFTYDFSTENIFFSDGFRELIDFKLLNFKNTIENILEIIHVDYKKAFEIFINQFGTQKTNYISEFEIKIKNKNSSWVLATLKSQILEFDTNTNLAKSICVVFSNLRDIDILELNEAANSANETNISNEVDVLTLMDENLFQANIYQELSLGAVFVSISDVNINSNSNFNDMSKIMPSVSSLKYLGCNNKFEEMFEVSKENIIGKKITDLVDNSIDFISAIVFDIFVRQKPFKSEEYHPILDKYFSILGFYASKKIITIVFDDITIRRSLAKDIVSDNNHLQAEIRKRNLELENLLYQLNSELENKEVREIELVATTNELQKALAVEENINKIKSDFISMISHEYRTPLTTIQTSVFIIETLFEMQKKDDFCKYVGLINSAIKTMLSLLDNTLMLDSDERSITINPINHDIVFICENIIKDFKNSSYCRNRNIIFTSNLEKLLFNTDVIHLTTVIRNILENSCKFSNSEKDILFNISRENRKLIINIIDDGRGIPADEVGKIFEPFFRGSNVKSISGSGLGLSIAEKYARVIQGEIKTTSVQNKGTTTTIIINELK